jgi:hypothetical protein
VLLEQPERELRESWPEHQGSALADPPSRSIAARVARDEAAAADDRTPRAGRAPARTRLDPRDLRLKSVLCVPISAPAGRLGALLRR